MALEWYSLGARRATATQTHASRAIDLDRLFAARRRRPRIGRAPFRLTTRDGSPPGLPPLHASSARVCRTPVRQGGVRSGAALLVLRDLGRTLQRGRGPLHSADLHPMPVRAPSPARRATRPARPGQPWLQWGCPIEGCGRWVIGPWELEGHTAAEHPGWTATYELLRPYPNQRQRVVYRRSAAPSSAG
jgi:hypothetical protein